MAKIVVVGAGVSGLTSAFMLADKGHDVTVIAKKFSFDGYDDPCYTSNYAGANWHSFASADQFVLQDYDKPGYKKFMRLAETEPRSGVWKRRDLNMIDKDRFAEVYGNDASKVALPWYKDFVQGFRIIPAEELPSNTGFGYEYSNVVISVPVYLSYLLSKCVDSGVKYKRVTLGHIKDASKYHSSGSPADVIVNCTGILASKLPGVMDAAVHPIRGQIIVVENSIETLYGVEKFDPKYPDDLLYLMPRMEGGTIIGGCMLPNSWDGKFDEAMGERTLAAAAKYVPEFLDPKRGNPTEFRIVRKQVGFRPGRTGGPRIEISDRNIVHNYGHAGAGYQASYGASAKVVELVEKVLNAPKL